MRIGIVGLILVLALVTNVTVNAKFTGYADHFPFMGVAVWLAILLSIPVRRPDWEVLPESFKGSIFLLALVLIASMMPVEKLPLASWSTALGLGFLSAVFDNIPLTALALKQGGYDWGFLHLVWRSPICIPKQDPSANGCGTAGTLSPHMSLAFLLCCGLVIGIPIFPITERRRPRRLCGGNSSKLKRPLSRCRSKLRKPSPAPAGRLSTAFNI
jgi:hypothetical protein